MEENSVVFSVDSGECSEDEEDDIQRKEELRQLLSEQLHDDLLDDSIATSIDGEISVVSSVQYSLSPSERATPDLRTVNSLTPTHHMIANQSHDSHVTSSPTTATPPSTPSHQHRYSSDSAIPVQGEEHPHNDLHVEHPPTSLPALTQYPLNSVGVEHHLPTCTSTLSGLTPYPPNLDSPTYSGAVTNSNQAFLIQYQSQTGATHYNMTEGGERDLTSHNVQGPNEDAPESLDPHIPREKSDVFAGTSQAYGAPTNIQHVHEGGYFIRHPNTLNREPALESLTMANHKGEYLDQDLPGATMAGSRELDVLSPSLQQMGLRQLGVLFKARGRHIAELTQQISAQAEDNERHVRILRHEKLLLEKERDQLNVHVGELETIQVSLEKQAFTYQGQLGAEQTKSKALENNKKELLTRLQADEAMIKSLTEQVNELTSSDTLSRVRDSYSSALAQSDQQHQQELLTLQQQIGELREEIDKKEEAISQLEGELHEVQSHYETQLASKDQLLTQKDLQLQQHIKTASQRYSQKQDDGSGIAQQLDFGTGDGGERLVELAAQVEDLTYQLSTTHEELQAAIERAEQAEAIASEQTLRLSEVEGEREQYSSQLEDLHAELESFKSQVATEKKEALEQCRSACLKLHEESTQRLRDSVEADKEKTKQQHERHVAQLKSDLATVQEQYVALCREKEKLSTKLEEVERENMSSVQAALDKARLEWLQQQEALVKEAVSVAREEWQEGVELENRKKVELALQEQQAVWDKKLELEKAQAVALAKEQLSEELAEARRRLEEEHRHQVERLKGGGSGEEETDQPSSKKEEEWEREKGRAVDEAVRQARAKWMEEREKSLQSRVESAVSTAEKLWKEHHQNQVSKLQQQLSEATPPGPSPSSSTAATVERALQEAREKWEEEQQAKIQEALDTAKQKFDSELDMRVELAVTNERGKWEEQSRKAWQEQEQSLLATAHQEWSKAQESILRAEVERAKREWERETEKNAQSSVEEAVAHTKQHYEGLLKLVRSELIAKHEKEKLTMAGEIRQLEARVANILKEQQRLSDGGVSRRTSGSEASRNTGRPLSQASVSEMDLQRLRPLVHTAMINVKQDMLTLLSEMQKASNAHHQTELAQVREATAREMRHYYLQCLHQLVNGNTNGLHSGCYRQHPVYQPQAAVLPTTSMVENLRPKSQEAYQSEGDIRVTTGALSTHVLRTQNSNSHTHVPGKQQARKGASSSEKRKSMSSSPSRKSTSASSTSPSRTQLSSTVHHHYKTNASSSRKAVVGRLCKNTDTTSTGRHHQSAHLKSGIHCGASGHSGAAGSTVKKDLFGHSSTSKRGTSSNGLVQSDSKSVTGGKLKTSKR